VGPPYRLLLALIDVGMFCLAVAVNLPTPSPSQAAADTTANAAASAESDEQKPFDRYVESLQELDGNPAGLIRRFAATARSLATDLTNVSVTDDLINLPGPNEISPEEDMNSAERILQQAGGSARLFDALSRCAISAMEPLGLNGDIELLPAANRRTIMQLFPVAIMKYGNRLADLLGRRKLTNVAEADELRQLLSEFGRFSPPSCAGLGSSPETPLGELAGCAEDVAAVSVGELLNRAEGLRAGVTELGKFDYEQCYKIGRSCHVGPVVVDPPESDPAVACNGKAPPLERGSFETWKPLKAQYVQCIMDQMTASAEALAATAMNTKPVGGKANAGLVAELADQSRPLTIKEVALLGSDMTWCSATAPLPASVYCRNGKGSTIDEVGGQSLSWRAKAPGQLCVTEYQKDERCFSVAADRGKFTLTDTLGGAKTEFRIIPGGPPAGWSLTCQR
jgi:hypothetical protein